MHAIVREIPRELCELTRTSFLFVGPLLSRIDRVKLFAPGGDGIGRRRLDAHLYGLRRLGVAIANLLNLLNPGVVVLGGTLASAGEMLLAPLRAAMRDRFTFEAT